MDSMTQLTDQQQAILDFISKTVTSGRACPSQREIAEHFGFASKTAVVSHIDALAKKGFLIQNSRKARSLRLIERFKATVFQIPLLGSIPAGFGGEGEQENDECVPVTLEAVGFKPTRNTFALRVAGDSMIGKHICDGDIVLLEHGADPRPGQIVAALIDRKTTLKTFVKKNGKSFLKAENPKYPDLIPSEELVIQGVFRALIRKAKE
jgi:repressor LexA